MDFKHLRCSQSINGSNSAARILRGCKEPPSQIKRMNRATFNPVLTLILQLNQAIVDTTLSLDLKTKCCYIFGWLNDFGCSASPYHVRCSSHFGHRLHPHSRYDPPNQVPYDAIKDIGRRSAEPRDFRMGRRSAEGRRPLARSKSRIMELPSSHPHHFKGSIFSHSGCHATHPRKPSGGAE